MRLPCDPAQIRLSNVSQHQTQIREMVSGRRDRIPIAVLLADDNQPVVERLLQLAEDHRWRWVSLGNTQGRPPKDIALRGALVNFVPGNPKVEALLDLNLPAVRIGLWPHPEDDRLPSVVPDRPAAGRLAVDHFAERGFEHIAFIGRYPWAADEMMYDAFAARAQDVGCQCHLLQENFKKLRSELRPGKDLMELRKQVFTQWLSDIPKPLGLFTFGDPMAAIYCQWVVDAELRVPEDVAVLGLGNHAFVCESAAVPLSSIAFDPVAIAEAAVGMLASLISGEELESTTVMVPPKGLVHRQSTDVLAAKNPYVVQALRFMWEHITEDLSVDHIARHIGISRRTLERAFLQDLGRGVNREFQRRRLEKAREMLVLTDWRVLDIAELLQFSSSNYLCRAFRAEFGISPAAYRREHADLYLSQHS